MASKNEELPDLSPEDIEKICEIAEEAARKYIMSKVSLRKISDMDITVEVDGTKPFNVSVEVDLELSPLMRDYNVQELVDEAVGKAFEAIEAYLRELKCKSKK